MTVKKHIHCIGIGGIGISALARYYLAQGYRVTGTNMEHSPLLDTLASEGIEIITDGASAISADTEKVIYTEAIIDDDTLGLAGVRANHKPEIEAGQAFHSQILSYPEALAELFHTFPMKIAVAWAHGKSTTSAMIGTVLHDLQKCKEQNAKSKMEDYVLGATTITGTLVKAFNGRNICVEGNEVMNIEACEYRNAFLHYHPDIAVVTNIDPDHLDFFKTEEAYQAAFEKFMGQARCVVILDTEWQNLQSTIYNLQSTIVIVSEHSFEVRGEPFNGIQPGVYPYTLPTLLVPGDHIRLDASLAYVVSQLLHLDAEKSLTSLAQYPGSWRRMEMIRTTENSNLLMSDYGHHPTEIIVTLSALKKAHPDMKLIVFFEPHQYSRTYELREEFATSFTSTDMTYISDIYAARDIDERRDMITAKVLAEMVAKNSPCEYVGTLEDARTKLQTVDSTEKNALLLLLWAGNIDELRN
jgi:UDP-N-acetylmuramate--alanine ligase